MKWYRVTVLGIAAALIAGCAAKPAAPAARPTPEQILQVSESGFLEDYSLLRPGKVGQASLAYINPDADFASYDKMLFERVTIWRGSQLDEVPREDLERLANYLYDAIFTKLERDYEMVEERGPGVVRFSLALTEVKESNPEMHVYVSDVANEAPGAERQDPTVGTREFVGGATVEAELADAQTGEVLGAAVDSRLGGSPATEGADSWSEVREVFDFWAERISQRLRELRGGSEKSG